MIKQTKNVPKLGKTGQSLFRRQSPQVENRQGFRKDMLLELDNHCGENNSRILPASENHPPVVGETFTEKQLRNRNRNTPNADPTSLISSTVIRTSLFHDCSIGL